MSEEKVYAITGGASGIGAALSEKLQARGDKVISIDILRADINVDLSGREGCEAMSQKLAELSPEGLDGFVACAGVGPHIKPFSLIDQINYFGAIASVEHTLPLLERKHGSIVLVSSNSAPLPGLNESHIDLLLSGDEQKACELIATLDGHNAYAGSKRALVRWMRKQSAHYMKKGVRMNAVAPGMTKTALTDQVFEDELYGKAMREFAKSIPYGEVATPDMIADAMIFLLDPVSRFVCGSVLVVDGGQDALLREDPF
ncbi:MAG: SDR family oxidoreductase [Pseudomonadales bacterium]|nr:SDR family oxidoreductase [Pseudomonadales bacterium]